MINRDANYYSADSSERRIQEVLVPLIKEMKEKMYTDEFKRSDDFKTEDTELDVLGMIVSKYCEWDGNRIEAVSRAAFEDSNFEPIIEY